MTNSQESKIILYNYNVKMFVISLKSFGLRVHKICM